MKLYYAPGACSLSPHIVIEEAGLSVQLKKVDLAASQVEGGGDYLLINSKGYVPALELDDGSILTEGPAIVQYLADRKPDSGLMPAPGTMERYRAQEWLNFISSEIHKNFSPLFNPHAAPEWKAGVLDNLRNRVGWLDRQIAGRRYLMGDAFTVADAYLFTVLSWSGLVGLDLAPWPALTAYLERVRARPHVQAALQAEGLTG
jgi:glutathione S-transferase